MSHNESVSIDRKVKGSLDSELYFIAEDLRRRKYEVNDERKEYRVIMFRKASKQWSQGHTNRHEDNIRFYGPEALAVHGQDLPATDIYFGLSKNGVRVEHLGQRELVKLVYQMVRTPGVNHVDRSPDFSEEI